MKRTTGYVGALIGLAISLATQFSSAQNTTKAPHIGYAYPAGGERGTSFEITIGGRYLGGAKKALVTGKGIEVEVLGHFGNYQRRYKSYLRDLSKKARILNRDESFQNASPDERASAFQEMVASVETVMQGNREFTVPDHPYFTRVANLSPEEFQEVSRKYMSMESVQTNNEIAELLTLRITIAPDSPLGARELRLRSYNGYSNPIFFQVGGIPEIHETEPNDQSVESTPLQTPFIQNGQIMPGDMDRIRFSATKGQKLVLNAQARQLVPYLADAVPGWFQAVLSLYDSTGKEIAYADDHLFNPDPVILFEVPADGIYEARIHDSIYRGREDFVYRLSVAESPFVTSYFPLGSQVGDPQTIELQGWNLPSRKIRIGNRATNPTHATRYIKTELTLSNAIHYETTDSQNVFEDETNNDSFAQAQTIDYPCTINGRIDKPGDKDVYLIKGSAGQALIAEVRARRLHSPVDSTLQLFDQSGNQIAWNDDPSAQLNVGVLTHHADSKLEATFPEDGEYYLQITDTQNQGGPAYGYRLQIDDPQPDFEIWAYPSITQIGAGQSVAMTAKVSRKDGFDGPVSIQLAGDPTGFALSGATIPKGKNEITFTLTAPERTRSPITRIKLTALGEGEIEDISRTVIPCDQRTQAFITPHYLETRSFTVETLRRPRVNIHYAAKHREPLKLSSSDLVSLSFEKRDATDLSKSKLQIESFEYKLRSQTLGLKLLESKDSKGSVEFTLSHEPSNSDTLEGNLIIDAYAKVRNPKAKNKKIQSVYLGTLPAIPCQVTL